MKTVKFGYKHLIFSSIVFLSVILFTSGFAFGANHCTEPGDFSCAGGTDGSTTSDDQRSEQSQIDDNKPYSVDQDAVPGLDQDLIAVIVVAVIVVAVLKLVLKEIKL